MKKFVTTGIAALMLAVLSACTTYYKVTDPSSGKVFYTTNIDKNISGAIVFKDEKSKSEVTLQSSEIAEIGSDEYDKAVGNE